MSSAEIRVHLAALYVSLVKAGELEAAESLMEWASDNLDVDTDELEEEFSDNA